jgi:hypothetical protein
LEIPHSALIRFLVHNPLQSAIAFIYGAMTGTLARVDVLKYFDSTRNGMLV